MQPNNYSVLYRDRFIKICNIRSMILTKKYIRDGSSNEKPNEIQRYGTTDLSQIHALRHI